MFFKSVVAVALLASCSVAQSNNTIPAGSVDATTRAQWCGAQSTTCATLCQGVSGTTTPKNECEPNNLLYTCTCANGTAPGLQYYKETMPFFQCERTYENCIKAGQSQTNAQAATKKCDDERAASCGKLNPTDFVAPTSTSSSSAAPTATNAAASSGAPPASSTSAAAAAPTMVSRELGTGVLAAGAAVAFGLFL